MNPLENLLMRHKQLFFFGTTLTGSMFSPLLTEWLKTSAYLLLYT